MTTNEITPADYRYYAVDLLTNTKLFWFGLKNIDFRYNHYQRSNNLNADIFTIGFKFIML